MYEYYIKSHENYWKLFLFNLLTVLQQWIEIRDCNLRYRTNVE